MKVVIERSEWRTGGSVFDDQYDYTALLHPRNNMKCCLGFLSLACGLSEKDISGLCYPFEVAEEKQEKIRLLILDDDGHIVNNSRLATQAMEINDDNGLSNEEREAQLTELFAAHDIELEFVGEYRS